MNGTLDATERELTAHGPRHDWKSIHGQAVILGFLLVATQRMAIHLGHGMLQVPTVILAATVVWFLARLKRRPDLSGALWYAGLVLCAAFSALLGAGSGLASMVLPFALFIVTYSPVLVAGSPTGIGRAYLEGAMGAVRLGSILGVFQYIWQASGRGFFDPMKYLPEWLSAEGFNSYYPLAWGSTQYKPNGVIFLEPSLLSLLPAIAIVYTLSRTFGAGPSRIREIVWLIPLSLGIAISASASGLVVLLPCTLVLLVGIRKNGSVAVALALLALLASFAGIFDSVIEKAGEGVSGQTSTGLRLVYPYQALAPAWLERPLFGHGSGAVTEYVAESGLVALQASTLMKALVEYGAVGTAVIGAVLVRLMMASQAPAAVKVAGVCAWLLPADNLVSPVLVGLMLFALPQWPCFDGALRDAPPVKVGRGLSGKTLGELSTVRLW